MCVRYWHLVGLPLSKAKARQWAMKDCIESNDPLREGLVEKSGAVSRAAGAAWKIGWQALGAEQCTQH